MPTTDYIGISRRIDSDRERDRLKELASRIKPENMGLIVRTVAEGVDEAELRGDVNMLLQLWQKINSRIARSPAPVLVQPRLGAEPQES